MAEENDSKSSVELATKLVQLGRARDKTETILQAAKESAIKRHVETLREIINEVNKLVRTIEAEKITAKENSDEIDTWIGEIEEKLNEGDEKITILEQWLNETREKREYSDQKKKLDFEMELHEAKMKLQAQQINKESSKELTSNSKSEAKVIKEIFKAAHIEEDIMDLLLDKYPLPKVLRIGAWVRRFILNCKRQPAEREKGPINSREVQQQREWWIRRAQDAVKHDARYLADRERLNLQENNLGILECRGRIIGEYPIYIPDFHPFASSLVREAHLSTLHGGVSTTMAKCCSSSYVTHKRHCRG
ncbi:Hypothetical predicted protein [Paramuricea clavata]|uniref:Uncharacterized protein n=1 Tax=Paramuricea clavata TaxID=317549 RepID=A0A6S7HV61_PARCT|nr:Hypothetical predicted protein [Paramuricea clavata]